MELVRSYAHMDAHGTLADGSPVMVLFGPNSTVAAEDSDALARLLADGEEGAWGEGTRSLWCVLHWRFLLRFLLNKGF